MGLAHIFRLIVAMSFLSLAYAGEESVVQGLSEGACWLEQGEVIKVASFNDQESIYNEEIKRLNTLFNYLGVLSK